MWKQWLYSGIIVVLSFYLIVNASRKVWQLWQAQSVLTQSEQKLEGAYAEQLRLEKSLAEHQSEGFVESEARERLNLVKPGETVVLVPKDLPRAVEYREEQPVVVKENWELWMERFL